LALDWGRRYLMCPPRFFDVVYQINPWMDARVPVDHERAWRQWDQLVSTLTAAGARVETLPGEPGLPDMVFTANAGIVDGGCFVPAVMKHPERQPEIPHAMAWFAGGGFELVELGAGVVQEGAGDALPFAGGLVAGHRSRSSRAAYDRLERLAGWTVHRLELADPRYYHVDLVFCPLDERRAMIAPGALTAQGRKLLAELVPEPLALEDQEAASFCANSVVVGRTVVMPHCPPRVGRRLERWGFDVEVVDVSEFTKAGGACRCLTLALDVRIGTGQTAAA
jgi:N-dimethylarginine dimethylaminohydrolase